MPEKELTPEARHRCLVIADLMETREIQVTQLARDTKLSARWLISIRQGKASPSFAVCKKIAHAIGVPVGQITAEAFHAAAAEAVEAEDAA